MRLPFLTALSTWPVLIWFWISHLVAPLGLGSFYEIRAVDHPGVRNFVLPAAAVSATLVALVAAAKRSREVAFAACWIFIPLVPLLDIWVLPRNDFAHDRYLYLPSVGLAIILAMALRKIRSGNRSIFGFPAAQLVTAATLALVLGFATSRQAFYFENNWVFYRYNYFLSPTNGFCANDYAVALAAAGRDREAIEVLKRAINDDPNWSSVYNLGYLYYKTGKLDLAEQYLRRAISLGAYDSDNYVYLGMTCYKLDRLDEAETLFRRAISLKPTGRGYHLALGEVLARKGNRTEALRELRAELANYPDEAAAQKAIDGLSRQSAPPVGR